MSRQRSPARKKDLFEKIGDTLARKKTKNETNDLLVEVEEVFGQLAVQLPYDDKLLIKQTMDKLEEGEQKRIVTSESCKDPKFVELIDTLTEWINDTLLHERIIVKNLAEDLFDGHVFQKLFETLSQQQLAVPEVVQSDIGQKEKLKQILSEVNTVLQNPQVQWTVELIHGKDLVSILQLLVALIRHYCAPIRLPDNVRAHVIVVMKKDGRPMTMEQDHAITLDDEYYVNRGEKDAFDTLFDYAPDKLNMVKKILVDFVNGNLYKLNLQVTQIDSQFADGVYLILLIGMLYDYFVPFYSYFPTPTTKQERIKNVQVAFELMADAELPPPKARPEDVVNQDLKSTLRILYTLYSKFKNVDRSRTADY